MQPQSRYILGRIYEKQGNFKKAVMCYQDAMKLGLNTIDVLSKLLKISYYIKAKDDIIKYVSLRYKEFKKKFARTKRLSLKKKREIKGLPRFEKKMAALERRLQKVRSGMKGEGGGKI